MDTLQARVFLTHLLPELQKIQKIGARWSSLSKRSRAIRMVSDMCLAKTANAASRSAWSRALNLHSHRRITKLIAKNKYFKSPSLAMRRLSLRLRLKSLRSFKATQKCRSQGGAVERRVRVLQMLVPGGREMEDMGVLLHETADYITNLKMQVKAMQALADFRHTEFTDRCIEGQFHDNKCSFQQVVSGV